MAEEITSYSEVYECMVAVLSDLGIKPTNVETSTHSIYFRDEKTEQDFVFTLDLLQDELVKIDFEDAEHQAIKEKLDSEWDGPGIGTEVVE